MQEMEYFLLNQSGGLRMVLRDGARSREESR